MTKHTRPRVAAQVSSAVLERIIGTQLALGRPEGALVARRIAREAGAPINEENVSAARAEMEAELERWRQAAPAQPAVHADVVLDSPPDSGAAAPTS